MDATNFDSCRTLKDSADDVIVGISYCNGFMHQLLTKIGDGDDLDAVNDADESIICWQQES